MRRLDRSACTAPACLANYQPGQHSWDHVGPDSKAEIRARLEIMQGRRCAYCEGSLDELGQHIEHFRRKGAGQFPELTFDWNNLFWSCYQDDSCGRYKDLHAEAFDINDLINPCVDDPDRFFRFRSDGTISVKYGLSALDQGRAEETLRVFNLHPQWGRLRNMRKCAVAPYIALASDATGFTVQELRDFFSDELAAASSSPFYTAIRHTLTEP